MARDRAVGRVEDAHDLEPYGIAECLEHVDELDVLAIGIVELPHVLHHAASSSSFACASAAASAAFGRSSHATRPDATITTAIATHSVESKAVTKESRAAVPMFPPRTPPTACACCSASASECVAFAGSPATDALNEDRKRDATRLPSTATPTAPPSSRVVSFTAEPTPALCSGSERMMAPVDGAVVMPMPSACTTSPIANSQ